jgi:uncharacterized protein (TIGR02145 family)
MAITVSFTIFAQAPNAFNYQGVARDLTGNPILNRNIGIRVSILQGTITGNEAYKELHLISTSNTGLFNIQIGGGTPVSGSIGSINWGEGSFFLKIEMDENGGSSYKLIGTNQLLSVPYALYAEKSGNSTLWSKNGSNVYYNNGNVGIGITNPMNKLQILVDSNDFAVPFSVINKNTGANSAANIGVRCDGPSAFSFGKLGEKATGWPGYGTPGTSYIYNGKYGKGLNIIVPDSTDGKINFFVGTTAKSTPKLMIANNGNIGIGTTNPVSKLQVSNGDVMIPEGNLYFGKFLKIGDYNANSHINQFELNQNSIIYGRYLNGLYGNMVIQANSTEYASSINFVTGSSLSRDNNPPALRMVIMGNGNIGIGKTPSTKLDINGVVNVNDNNITNVATPKNDKDAVNKAYVDALMDRLYEQGVLKIKDVDGNYYNVVKIGDQFWMAENLKTTKYRDGTSLLNVSDSTTWTNMTTDAYCWYKNDSVANSNKYGALYNWYAASNEKLCPTGWHVPTDLEWTVLEEFLGGSSIAGGRMKTVNGWNSPNTGATNSSGFSGISSGNRREDGLFPTVGYIAIWWTSTEFSSTAAKFKHLYYNNSFLNSGNNHKEAGSSVRCIKN